MQNQILRLINKKYLFKVLILFCLLVLLNSNSLFNEFTMDDHSLILKDHLTRNLDLFKVFKKSILGSGYFYRPLVQAFLIIEYIFFKSNTFGYHFVNIALHFINCLLFFRLLNFLFGNNSLSLLTASLFAVHPIHNQLINQCVASDVLLVSMFMLFSILSFIKFMEGNNLKSYYLSIIFFVIALFLRESAMLLPFYLICLILFYLRKGGFKKYFYLILTFFIIGAGYFLFRLFFFSLKEAIFNELTKTFTFLDYISGFLRLIWLYLHSIIIPKGIVWIWSISHEENFFGFKVIIFALISLCVTYIAIKHWKKDARSFAVTWFLVGALPTILVISSKCLFGDLIMEPHWLYLSSIGVFLFASFFLFKLKKYINSKLWLCLIFCIFLFYCRETRRYNYLWKDNKTYYEYWLSVFPNNSIRINLANVYSGEGRYEEAESLYKESIAHSILRKGNKIFFSPTQISTVYNNLGSLYYYKQGRFDEAFRMFNKAIEIDSSNSLAYSNRANIFLEKNKLSEAISDYEKSVAIDPYNLDAHYNLAILYARLNKEDRAIEEYSKAVALDKNCFKNNKVK